LENSPNPCFGGHPKRSDFGLADQTLGHAASSLPIPRNRIGLPTACPLRQRIRFCIISRQQSFRRCLGSWTFVLQPMEGHRSVFGDFVGWYGLLVTNQSGGPFSIGYCLRGRAWRPYRIYFMDPIQPYKGPPPCILWD
jgi:hypothetical protein